MALTTSHGQLGNCSKCALRPSGPMYVICVYSPDFRNRQEVKRVLNGLRKIGVVADGTPDGDQQQQGGGGGGRGFRGNKRVHYKLDLLTYVWQAASRNPCTAYTESLTCCAVLCALSLPLCVLRMCVDWWVIRILDVFSSGKGTWADLRLAPVTQYSSNDFTDEE